MRRPKPLAVPIPLMNVVASAILVLAMLVLLVACGTATPTVDVQVQCLPLKTYTAAEQANLMASYDALPANSPLRSVIQDYEAMRDADRACQAKTH